MNIHTTHWIAASIAMGLVVAVAVSAKELTYTIQVGIPGFAKAGEQIIISPSTMKALVIALHNFAVYAGGTIAIVMGLWGGLKWVSAGGNPSHVESAKETIYAAILGLLLLLGSYVMLKTVNPALVDPQSLNLSAIQRVESRPLDLEVRQSENEPGLAHTTPQEGERYTGPIASDCQSLRNRAGLTFAPQNTNDRDELPTGEITSRRFTTETVRLDPKLCGTLNAMLDSGLNVHVTSIVGGHRMDNGAGGKSPHMLGRGIDFRNDERALQWLYTNKDRLGVSQIITGRYRSYNFDRNGRSFSSGLLNEHNDHIHVTFNQS